MGRLSDVIFLLMNILGDRMLEDLMSAMRDVLAPVGAFLPNILGALAILVVGWIVAIVVSRVLQTGLVRLGVGGLINKGLAESQRYETGKIERIVGKAVFAVLMLFVLVGFFQTLGLTEITQPLTGFLNQLFVYAPRLIGPALLIFVAWVVANLLRALTRRVLAALKLDERLASDAGLEVAAERPASATISDGVYWLTYLVFLPAILSALELTGLLGPVRSAMNEIIGFLPNLFAAGLILLVGWIVARVLRRLTVNFLVAIGLETWSKGAGLGAAAGKQSVSGAVGLIVYVIVFIPVLVAALNALELAAITQPASEMLGAILLVLPNIFAGGLLLILAFFVGRVVGGLASGVLTSVGFNDVVQKIGITGTDRIGGRTISEIAGYLIYLAILLFASIEALNLIGFESLGILLSAFFVFASRILFGIVIIGLGVFVGKLVGQIVASMNIPSAVTVGLGARVAVVILAVAMGVRQMGVAEDIITLAFGLILGAVAVALAIAFGMGGRDAASRFLETRLPENTGSPKDSQPGHK